MAATLAIAKIIPHRYTATAEILVDPRDLRVLDKEVTPRSVATDSGITVVESQVAVLASNSVLKRAIDKLGLESDPEFNGKSENVFGRAFAEFTEFINPPKPAQIGMVTLQTLKQDLAVVRPERTFIIQLTVSTRDEDKSVRIADAIVGAYLEDQAQYRSSSNEGAAEAIDASLEGMKARVKEAEEKIAAYKAKHDLGLASGRLVAEQQLTDTNNQLAVARADTGRIKAQLEDIKSSKGKGDSIPEVLNSQTLVNLKKQLAAASADRARLGAQLLPRHPALVALEEQERQIRGDIDQEIKRILATVAHDYERAKQREESLAKSVADLQADMNTSSVAQIQLRELERDLEGTRSLYEQSVARSRETREQSRLNTSNVRVISSAIAAPNRAFPPRNVLLAPAGFMLGMLLGAGLIARRQLVSIASPKRPLDDRSQHAGPYGIDEFESRIMTRDAPEASSALKATQWRQSAMATPPPLDADDVEIELRIPKSASAPKNKPRIANKKVAKVRALQAVDALVRRHDESVAGQALTPETSVLAVLASAGAKAPPPMAEQPVGVNDNADVATKTSGPNDEKTPHIEVPAFDFRQVSELVQTASRYPSGMAIKRLADGVVSSRHGAFARQVRELHRTLFSRNRETTGAPHVVAFTSEGEIAIKPVIIEAVAKACAEAGQTVLIVSSQLLPADRQSDAAFEVLSSEISPIDVLKFASDAAPVSTEELAAKNVHDVVIVDSPKAAPKITLDAKCDIVHLHRANTFERVEVDAAVAALAGAKRNLRSVILIADGDEGSAPAVHAAS